MPAVCIGRHAAAGRSPKHTQHRRLIIGPGRRRQEVEIALDEPRHRGATSCSVSLRAANHLPIHAERQLRHIRMIPRHSYVSQFWVQAVGLWRRRKTKEPARSFQAAKRRDIALLDCAANVYCGPADIADRISWSFTTVGQVQDGHQIGENVVTVPELAACLNYYWSGLSVEAAS
jgi:hypothetical protein